MPGNGTIVVDTSRLAESVDEISSNVQDTTQAVNQTTSAVQQMAASVCAAEAAAAAAVSRRVTSGFRGLISAQLAQKKIQCFTEIQSKAQLLEYFSSSLDRLKKQLNNDYQRITKRYNKIITTLNNELHSRLCRLDAPAAEVSEQNYRMIFNRSISCGIPSLMVDQEVQPLSSMTVLYRCKNNCTKVLGEINTMAADFKILRESLARVIRQEALTERRRKNLPVLIMESDDLKLSQFRKTDVIPGDSNYQQKLKTDISNAYENGQSGIIWQENGSGRAVIEEKVRKIATEADLDDRHRQLILDLLAKSNWQKIGEIK